jgi:putative hemolysin
MLFEITIILLLFLASGLFSMAEMAVVSSRKAKLRQNANAGDAGAKVALELANNPNQLLSAVQIGMSLVSILTGAFGGVTVAGELSVYLKDISFISPYRDGLSLAVVVLLIAFFNLVIGELVPKRIALGNPERIASLTASPLRLFSEMISPLILLLSGSTDLVLRVLGVKTYVEPSVTEEEIRILIDQGTSAGVIEEEEQDIMERVFSLGDRPVNSIMTPRGEIVWLDIDDSHEEIQSKIADGPYSMFPVCSKKLDNVIGVVQAKDLLSCNLLDNEVNLKSALLPPLFVPESMRALKVLEKFKQTGIHLAIVLDEYGSVQGIVALIDLLEGLVGDIPHIDDLADPEIMQRSDGSWLVDGSLPIEEFKEWLNIESLPEEESELYQSIGGFVMMQLENVPSTGDHFEWGGYRFEVIDMDERRVDKLLITPLKGKGI